MAEPLCEVAGDNFSEWFRCVAGVVEVFKGNCQETLSMRRADGARASEEVLVCLIDSVTMRAFVILCFIVTMYFFTGR